MKKLLCIILSIVMIVGILALSGCAGCTANNTDNTPSDNTPGDNTPGDNTPGDNTPATLKFGMGVAISTSASDATPDENGTGEVDSTAAVILVDKDGKVVSCKIDVAQIEAKWTDEGKAVATTDFRTKGEKGDAYGMSRIGKTEWYLQAAAFEAIVVGKTLDEIKALVAEDGKGTADVKAGCTITISEFVKAIEKAFANLADSTATADSTLQLGMATEQTLKDFDTEKVTDGSNEIDTTIFATAVDADGKIQAVDTDCVQVEFTFTGVGTSTFNAEQEVLSKRQKGDAYGMSRIGKTEWYAQADAFETQCIGKTAAEVAGLLGEDGLHGTDAVKAAGCSIKIHGFVAAAAKTIPAAE